MKVLVIIISDNSQPTYSGCKKIWLEYMNQHPQFECWFIEYSENKENYQKEANTFYLKGTESYHPGIREKTIDCFEYFINQDTKYDYIVRTNLSSLWNFRALAKHLESQPKSGLYSGVIGNYKGIRYASGSGFIMTPDIVKKIVDNRHLCNQLNFIDDTDIGYMLSKLGIFPTPNLRTDILNKDALNRLIYSDEVYHYRIKFINRDDEYMTASHILGLIQSYSKQ